MAKPVTFAALLKDITAADVHVPSAGGTGKKKPKEACEKADWTTTLNITKMDSDRQQVFGWASVVEKGGNPIVDKQGDVIPVEELEKAAYDFVLNYREQDDMHAGGPTGRCIESMVFTMEKQEALGIDLGQVGWWVGFQVDDPALWKAHKEGKRPEFSIGGHSLKQKVS